MSKDPEILSLTKYAPEAKAMVLGAQALADERKHAAMSPIHLLAYGLERDTGVAEVFRRAGAEPLEIANLVERALGTLQRSTEPAYLASSTQDLLERAEREAQRDRSEKVGVEHLLNALSQEIRGGAGEVLAAFQIAPGSLRPHLSALRSVPRTAPGRSLPVAVAEFTTDLVDSARRRATDPVIGRDRELSRLLTVLERRGKSHPLLVGEAGVGKGAILRGLAQHFAAGSVPPALARARLLELQTGALVAGVRLRGDLEDRVRKFLTSLTDGGEVTCLVVKNLEGLFGSGPFGGAVGDLLRAALQRGNLRLIGTTTPEGVRRIQEKDAELLRLLTPLEVAPPSSAEATEILRGLALRYEEHHGIQIGESAILASVQLAKRYVQDRFLPDSAIDLLDEAVAAKRVEADGSGTELDRAERRVAALRAQLASLANAEDRITSEARQKLEAELAQVEPKAQELKQAYEARRSLVTRLADLRRELDAGRSRLERAREAKDFAQVGELEHGTLPELEKRYAEAEAEASRVGLSVAGRVVGEEDVARTLEAWTGIPVSKMLEGETRKLLELEARLGGRVVGQDDAVRAIARAVRRGRVGLRDPGKPIGSFLFLGPSGVGKTELAKALAELLFDDEQALTRLDMSEFMERHMAQRLIGAPPGYADSEQGGFLTEAVRRRPYSVLLFDEVEKAHQDVFNLLLQLLDDGRLTDGRGRLADFSNTVVILTSNIGSKRILDTDAKLFESDDGREALRDVLLEELHAFFRPEFLNRIDDVVVFRPLSRDHLHRIVDIQLKRLTQLLAHRRLGLVLEPSARERLVDLAYEPALGARPLKRALVRHVQDPLAEALLAGDYPDGTTLRVFADGEALRFAPVEAGA
jgi:ATP-dependent Clp protease ATP-binding subunit ClpB